MEQESSNKGEDGNPRWEKARIYFYKACLAIDIIGITLIIFGLILYMINT